MKRKPLCYLTLFPLPFLALGNLSSPLSLSAGINDYAGSCTKHICGEEGGDLKFDIAYAGGSFYVDIAVKDSLLSNKNNAGVELLFLADEVPSGEEAIKLGTDVPAEVVSFNLAPWMPCSGSGSNLAPIPYVLHDGATSAEKAGISLFDNSVFEVESGLTDGYFVYHTVFVLKNEHKTKVEELGKFGFDIRYVNTEASLRQIGWCSEEANIYDDLRKIGSVDITQGIPEAEREYVLDTYRYNVALGNIPSSPFTVNGQISEEETLQVAFDEESLIFALNVKDVEKSNGGAYDWVRFAIDLEGIPPVPMNMASRVYAGCYAFNLAPWLPNADGVPVNYGAVGSSNGVAILERLDINYVYEDTGVRLVMKAVLKEQYRRFLAPGKEIGLSIQYNDNLAAGSDGSVSSRFLLWGDVDGAIDNDVSKMGRLRLMENPNGETRTLEELYTDPYFEGNQILNESVMFIENEDGSVDDAPLLYTPDTVLSIRSSDLFTEYEEGVDYSVVNGKIRRLEGSRIPLTKYEDYYPSTKNGGVFGGTMDKVGGGFVSFKEGYAFHMQQVAVSYTHSSSWQGSPIYGKASLLPKTMEKLQKKENLRISILGDSVSEGCNATGFVGAAPYSPKWSEMTVTRLKQIYQTENIELNTTYARGGMDSSWGVSQADNVAATNPDLVVVEFAGNEGTRTVRSYIASMERIMSTIKTNHPDCEFIFVSNFVPNPEAVMNQGCVKNVPAYAEGLLWLEKEGVACCDIYSVYQNLISVKRYYDMTGNNINHPNDFLIRLYAQMMLRTLSDTNPVPPKEDIEDSSEETSSIESIESSEPIEESTFSEEESFIQIEDSNPSSSESSSSNGCGGSLVTGASLLGAIGLLGVAIALGLKKKEE